MMRRASSIRAGLPEHLRFSDDDIAQIVAEGAGPPVTRRRSTRR